jgi:hypothetical protein
MTYQFVVELCLLVGRGGGREHELMHLHVQFSSEVRYRLACLDPGRWRQEDVRLCVVCHVFK